MSGEYRGNAREIPGEMSGKRPGNTQEMPGKCSGNAREIPDGRETP